MSSYICRFAGIDAAEDRMSFGYTVMGPILADMLRQMYVRLQTSQPSMVFFCSRGGLVLRRALNLFTHSVGLDLQVQCEDFMVSRLTAFRAAFQLDPMAIAPLIEIEFAGRTCAQAVHALWDIKVDDELNWNAPFSLARLVQITQDGELGERIRATNDKQSALLRDYIDRLRGMNRRIVLCDTGVFGSVLQYLRVGVPAIDWRLILLFRANYKRISTPHFDFAAGVMSESDIYLPWNSCTVALLYWQLIEAMLEPALPTVRWYRCEPVGKVLSNLEIPLWEDRLDPPKDSFLSGACNYLRDLTPTSLPAIRSRGQRAWSQLRRMIVFPSRKDVELLQVGPRNLDFGTTEMVQFTSHLDTPGRSLREKISIASASMWPEGELRKQLPWIASPFLLVSEFSRWMRALNHK